MLVDQARNPNSALCRFLDDYMPNRKTVADQWIGELGPSGDVTPVVDPRRVGKAFELRVSLDVASRAGWWPVLEFLSPRDCRNVLEATGFVPGPCTDALTDTGTTDPLLRAWERAGRPDVLDDRECHVLETLVRVVGMDQPAHTLSRSFTVEQRRAMFAHDCQPARPATLDEVCGSWSAYLERGREELLALGTDRVIVSPVIIPGFAIGDLVVGSTLVDVKVSTRHETNMLGWLDQVIGYWLLDRWKCLGVDRLGVYCARQAKLVSCGVADLLARSARPVPNVDFLRCKLAEVLHEDLERASHWHASQRLRV